MIKISLTDVMYCLEETNGNKRPTAGTVYQLCYRLLCLHE